MRHVIETPGSSCFTRLTLEGDLFTVHFRDGKVRTYRNGKRLFATALTVQQAGSSLGRWYNMQVRQQEVV